MSRFLLKFYISLKNPLFHCLTETEGFIIAYVLILDIPSYMGHYQRPLSEIAFLLLSFSLGPFLLLFSLTHYAVLNCWLINFVIAFLLYFTFSHP